MKNEELLTWINGMPEWVRKATILFYQKGVITDDDIKDLADVCLFGDNSFSVSGINLIDHGAIQGYSISSIDSVEGVNAISSDKPLEFKEKGITVVYGLNGAGKSGYIRVFKMISGAKYREEIKNNIYSDKKVMPRAIVSIRKDDGSKEQLVCDLKKPAEHDILRTLDIFDTKISNAYVNEAKEATYEPWIFTLFAELANVASKIKKELENRKRDYPIADYGFQDKYKDTKAYKMTANITYNTDCLVFPSEWKAEQEDELKELRRKNQISILNERLKQLEREDNSIDLLIGYFVKWEKYFCDTNWEKILNAQKEWKDSAQTKKASEILFSENASEIDARSIDIDSWKKLWQYAHSYSKDVLEKNGENRFTEIGSKCPLCGQIIENKYISERMDSIDSYVNGKVVETERSNYREYERQVKAYPTLKSPEEFKILLDSTGITEDIESVIRLHDDIITYANSLSGDLKSIELKQYSIKSFLDSFEALKKLVKEKYKRTKELMDDNAQKTLELQILEMEAESYLTSIHEVIKKNIENLAKIRELEQAIKLTSTNKITTKSKELAEEMITADYVRRFEIELKDLTKSSIAVKLSPQKAGKGKIPYKVVLCDVNGNQIAPQDILSEGENRVTSLAAFFAEASGRNETTPLIVDDPISSLDYSYEEKVIDRLVKAAKHRQVIVFTHRISMVVGIYEKTKQNGIDYQEVTLLSSKIKKGVPSDISNIGGKVASQLNNLINTKLSRLKKLNEFSEEYKSLCHNICQEFRNIVEKSVEDVLIGEVVKRFRRDIQTKGRLNKLVSITEDDCKLIDQLMTRYSYFDHSMSDETPLQEITIDELENDLLELKNWIAEKSKSK